MGADPNIKNIDGETVLCVALHNNMTLPVKLVLKSYQAG